MAAPAIFAKGRRQQHDARPQQREFSIQQAELRSHSGERKEKGQQ
jgi:hypothetical protein